MGMFSSLFGDGGAAERAAGVAAAGQKASQQMVQDQLNKTTATYQPYMDAGTGALSSYQNLAGQLPGQVNPILGQMGSTVNSMNPILGKLTSNNLNDYQQSPGYDFRMQQGQKALENSAAAKGTLFSGATGKALQEYGQNFGSNEYQNYLSNLQNQLTATNTQLGAQGNYLNSTLNANNAEMQPYQTLMNQGTTMAQGLGQLSQGAINTAAGYNSGAAASTAAGMQATANSLANAGANWINMGSAAAGAAMGMPSGGMPQVNSGAMNSQGALTQQMQQPQAYQGNGFSSGFQQGYNNPVAYSMQPGVNMPSNMTPPQGYIAPQGQGYNQPQYNAGNSYNPTGSYGGNAWNVGA